MSNAIPTMYNGIRFRSRLEAQWAAFFDLLGWKWDYEPIDLAGYIPDFLLTNVTAKGTGQCLVEVKPETSLGGLMDHQDKIAKSGWHGEALIVGARLMVDAYGRVVIGKGGMYLPEDSLWPGGFDWDYDDEIGARFFRCEHCQRVAVCAYNCNNCGLCGKTSDLPGDVDTGLLLSLWATAKNRVQWRGEFDGGK